MSINPNDISDSLDDAKFLLRSAKQVEVRLDLAEDREDLRVTEIDSLLTYMNEMEVAVEDIRDRLLEMRRVLEEGS